VQDRVKAREVKDAEMEDLDHNTNVGLNGARSENDSLRGKIAQAEQVTLKLRDTIDDKVKDSSGSQQTQVEINQA